MYIARMNFNRAVDIARALYNPEHKVRTFHVSVVFNKHRVVAIGVNSHKTHPLNKKNPKIGSDGTFNAKETGGQCSELSACIRLSKRTNIKAARCNMVNIRVMKDGALGNSKPCQSCQNLLKFFNFDKIYYSNEYGQFEKY
jgi:hypothetical protein